MQQYTYEEEERAGVSRFCDRWPWPSVLTFLLMIGSVILFCVCIHLATEDTVRLFYDTAAYHQLNDTIYWAQVGLYCLTGLMLFMVFILLSLGCLASGSYRREYVCRFPSRSCGICQMIVFGFVVYILFLVWIAVVAICMIPLWWFSIIKTVHCGDPGGCIDLRQFGLVPMTMPDEYARVCGSDLVTICVENPWDMYLLGTLGAIACLVLVGHFLMIFSANYAHIHDNFHRPQLQRGRNAASYNPTSSPNQYAPDAIALEEQENQYALSGRSRSRDPIGYSAANSKDPLSYQM